MAQVKKEQAPRSNKGGGCFLTETELRFSRHILISVVTDEVSLHDHIRASMQIFPGRVSCKKFLAPEREKADWVQDLLG